MNTIEDIERRGLSIAGRLPERVDRELAARYRIRDRLTATSAPATGPIRLQGVSDTLGGVSGAE